MQEVPVAVLRLHFIIVHFSLRQHIRYLNLLLFLTRFVQFLSGTSWSLFATAKKLFILTLLYLP